MKVPLPRILLVFLWPFSAAYSQEPAILTSQEPLVLTLADAESLFLKNNAQLIAQRYQIEQSKANIITAKLFENPEISYENLLYNHETGKLLETSHRSGQFSGSVSQLIRLAGKRNKDIKLARTEVEMEHLEYYDLMRTLKFELRNTFYEAVFTQRSASVYDHLLTGLSRLLNASELEHQKGNTASKDIIRIKSRLYGMKGEYTSIQNELEELKGRLRLLCGIEATTTVNLSDIGVDPRQFIPDSVPFQSLLDSAKVYRPDFQLAKTGLTHAADLLVLQKSRAVPDVSLSLSYDLKGNYPEKYTGIGVSMPIPLFNRNQGEIKSARIAIEASKSVIRHKEAEITSALYTDYQSAVKIAQLYKEIDDNFSHSFEQLMKGVYSNFSTRNISLLEFLDFYDSYKESTVQHNQIQYEVMHAKEALNFQTGTNIFK